MGDFNNFYKNIPVSPINVFYKTASPQLFNILKFILTQDPINIAIGTGLGFAFTTSFTKIINNLITPFIKYIGYFILKLAGTNPGYPRLDFNIYDTIEQIIVLIVFIIFIYYVVVLPVTALKKKYNIEQQTKQCPYCKMLINPLATRCPSCTSQLKELPAE
jgi:large conductance mechanosensitive channel